MASVYPTSLDNFVTNRIDDTVLSTIHAADHDNLNDAINKIEAELGLNPKGIYASVVERLSIIIQNTPTIDYTLVLDDATKVIELNKASPAIITVPPNSSVAFPIGTIIEFIQLGVGQVTFVAGAGVTIRSPSNNVRLASQYSTASLRKRATDEWVLVGDFQIFKTTSVAEISLASHATPGNRLNHSIKVRARTITGSTGIIRAALYEGSTNRSGDLETSVLTNVLTNYTLPISQANATAIISYTNLSIRVWGYDSVGNALVFEITKLNLTLPV